MTRLVTMAVLVALLATATTAQAANLRPYFVDECRDYVDEPLSNPGRTHCRNAISDSPDDTRRNVDRFVLDMRAHVDRLLLP